MPVRTSSPAQRYRRLTLVWGILITLTIGVVITFFLGKTVIERDLELNGQLIASYLNQELSADLFDAPQLEGQQDFVHVFKQLQRLIHVEHIKFISPTGQLIWSDAAELIGQPVEMDESEHKTLAGDLQVQYQWIGHAPTIQKKAKLENWLVPLIYEIYVPIRAGMDKVVGIAEIYRTPRFLLDEMLLGLFILWTILLLGGGIYFYLSNRLFVQASNDLVALTSNLEKSQRLAAVGECVSMIVHDTRNLLASIRFATARLNSDNITAEQRKGLIEGLKKPLQMSFVMMNEILNFVSGKKVPIICYKLELLALIEDDKSLLLSMLETSGHRLILNIPKDLIICCEPQKLLHILINLVRNSVESMTTPGEVSITAEAVEDGVLVTVEDTGKGIPEELMDTIFEPFVSERGKSRPGLGLAIIYDQMKRHGGEITVTNRTMGGARFVLFFPYNSSAQISTKGNLLEDEYSSATQ